MPGLSELQLMIPDLAIFYNVLRQIDSDSSVPLSNLLSVVVGKQASEDARAAYPESFTGLLSFLRALGALEVKNGNTNDPQIRYVSENASDFVLSAALCAKQGITAIETWRHKYTQDDPPWGRPLLHYMESRRLRVAARCGISPEAVRREEVAAVVIRSTAKRRGKQVEVYLCQHDEDSDHFNFVGGKKRRNGTLLQAAERRMHDELGLPVGSFRIEPLDVKGLIVARGLSHETSVYTEYTFQVFHATHIMAKARPSMQNRWFTLDEVMAGTGSKGEKIMAYREITEALRTRLNPATYPAGLSSLELSIGRAKDLGARRRPRLWDYLADREDRLRVIITLLALLSAVLSVLAALLKLLGIL